MFYITNDKKITKQIDNVMNIYSDDNIDIYSTDKYFIRKNSDSVIIFWGTAFYNNKKLQNDAIVFLSDFFANQNNSINNLFGAYFIIVISKNNIYYFRDQYGLFRSYEYTKSNYIYISNDIYTLGKYSPSLNININGLIEDSFQNCTLNEETLFYEIEKIKNTYLYKYDSLLKKKEITSINYLKEDIEFSLSNLTMSIESITDIICNNYRDIFLSMTGGVDSRLILSIFLHNGIKPNIIYGKGDSILTYTCDEDFEIAKQITKMYNLEFINLDWSHRKNIISDYDNLLEHFNSHFKIYNGNINVLINYINLSTSDSDFFEFGYFGEVFRSLDFQENLIHDRVEFEFLVSNYLRHDYNHLLFDSKTFISYLRNKIEFLIGHKELVTHRDINKLFLNYRYNADTHMLNFINSFSYSYPILINNTIISLILKVDEDKKKYYGLQLQLIDYFYKSLLEIPFFSHNQKKVFNKNRFRLKSQKKISDHIIDFAKLLYKKLPLADFKDQILIKFIAPYLKKHKHYNEFVSTLELQKTWSNDIWELEEDLNIKVLSRNTSYVYIRNLMSYYANLFMIKKIFDYKKNY